MSGSEAVSVAIALFAATLCILLPRREDSRFAAALGLLALLPFVVCLLWLHPQADDFDGGYRLRELGWWDAQRYWYLNWSGRYSAMLMQSSWAWPGFDSALYAGWMALVLALSWAAVAGWLRMLGFPRAAWLGAGLLASWALLANRSYPLWYWMAGAASYQFGWALGVCCLLAAWRAGRTGLHRGRWTATAALLGVLAVGCSESVALLLGTALACAALLALRGGQPWRAWALIAIAVLLGSAVAVAAPGNALRWQAEQARLPLRPDLSASLWAGAQTLAGLAVGLFAKPLACLLLLLACRFRARLAAPWRELPAWGPWLVLLGMTGAAWGVASATWYGTGEVPPPRVRILIELALLSALAVALPPLLPLRAPRALRLAAVHVRRAWRAQRVGWPIAGGAVLLWCVLTLVASGFALHIAESRLAAGLAAVGVLALALLAVRRRRSLSADRVLLLLCVIALLAHPRYLQAWLDAGVNGPRYDAVWDRRWEICEAEGKKRQAVRVPRLALDRIPGTFFLYDLRYHPEAMPNPICARMFGLESIHAEPPRYRERD